MRRFFCLLLLSGFIQPLYAAGLDDLLNSLKSVAPLARKAAAESLKNYRPTNKTDQDRIVQALMNATLPSHSMDHIPAHELVNLAIVSALEAHGKDNSQYIAWLLRTSAGHLFNDSVNSQAEKALDKIAREKPMAIEYWVKEPDPDLAIAATDTLLRVDKCRPETLEELSRHHELFELYMTMTQAHLAWVINIVDDAKKKKVRITELTMTNLLTLLERATTELESHDHSKQPFFRTEPDLLLEQVTSLTTLLTKKERASQRLLDLLTRLATVANDFPGDRRALRIRAEELQLLRTKCANWVRGLGN